jgi:NADPH:quinone reductase-like Zn-dependent oxidoreductase
MMPNDMMKAIQIHEFGGPEVLRYDELAIPEPQPGEALIRVHAIGLNPPDWYVREGLTILPPEMRPPLNLPIIPGTDVSGVIAAVAADVDSISVGDEVFGLLRFPSLKGGSAYAEYVTAPASDLARKPAGLDHVHAAGVPMAALTAWQFLIELGHDHPSPLQAQLHHPMALNAETTVLINGAAGGVGHFALQLAKWKGARVIAVASGTHEAFLRQLGADQFIDYTKNRPEDIAHDIDLVLDTAKLGVSTSTTQVRSNGAQLAELARMLDAGTLHIAIDSTFPLADARQAHERADRGHIQGKIVLTVA